MNAAIILAIVLPIILAGIVLAIILISTNVIPLGFKEQDDSKLTQLTKSFRMKKNHGKTRQSSMFESIPIYNDMEKLEEAVDGKVVYVHEKHKEKTNNWF